MKIKDKLESIATGIVSSIIGSILLSSLVIPVFGLVVSAAGSYFILKIGIQTGLASSIMEYPNGFFFSFFFLAFFLTRQFRVLV